MMRKRHGVTFLSAYILCSYQTLTQLQLWLAPIRDHNVEFRRHGTGYVSQSAVITTTVAPSSATTTAFPVPSQATTARPRTGKTPSGPPKPTTSPTQTSTPKKKPRVAVCVSGVPERLQPNHLMKGLIQPNQQQFDFHIIYSLAEHTELYYSTNAEQAFDPSPYAAYNTTESLAEKLQTLLPKDGGGGGNLTVLPFIPDLSLEEWREKLDLPTTTVPVFNAMSEYQDIQHKILNMYHHQVQCAEEIERLEKQQSDNLFDYIVSTREDAYFFHKMNLKKQLQVMDSDCDIIAKSCQHQGGINMRFQLFPRRSLAFLAGRLDHYKSLYNPPQDAHQPKKTIRNPEGLELHQAKAFHSMTYCPRSVEEIPVTAARHTHNGDFCFIRVELAGCVPRAARPFANNPKRACVNEPKRKATS